MSDGKSASDLIKKQVNALPKAPQYIQRDFKKFTEFANVIAGLLAASVESKATADNRKKLNAAKNISKKNSL